jgi:hypothetical protein
LNRPAQRIGTTLNPRKLLPAFVFDVRADLGETISHANDDPQTSVRCDLLIEEIVEISRRSKFRTLEALGECVACAAE